MKFKQISFTIAAALALGLAGCSKNESVTPVADDANKATNSTAEAVARAEAAKVEAARVETAKAEAAKAEAAKAEAKAEADKVEAAKAEAARVEAARAEAARTKAEAVSAAQSVKDQGLIDKAKGLVAENKLSEASGVLQQLAGRTLTPEQTKLVDGLKEQIQKALAANATENAAGAVGNLLKK